MSGLARAPFDGRCLAESTSMLKFKIARALAHLGIRSRRKCIKQPGVLLVMTRPCHISKIARGECDICRCSTDALHMPEELHGWYCAKCCPVCADATEQVKVAA
jgi:hypothetical protein